MGFNFKIFIIGLVMFIFVISSSMIYASDLEGDNVTVSFSVNSSSDVALSVCDDDLLHKSHSLSKGNFEDIQNIVDNANDGDTIVLEGSFKSNGKSIELNKKLNIVSYNGVTLDGNGKSRVFNINSNANGLVIQNILFKNAYSKSYGGAIYLNAANVVVDNCIFQDCSALSGGAVATPDVDVKADNLVIKNSRFNSNHVNAFGGAILYISQNLQIASCTFDYNYVELKNSMGGGGVMQLGVENQDNNCKITGCLFSNNYIIPHDDNRGHAGVACLRRGVTFENCNFTNNNAYNYGVLGFHDGGAVINCKFYNNNALESAGVIGFDPTNQSIFVSNSNFNNNHAKNGGAIVITHCNKVNIIQSHFFNNSVTNYAGAIWITDSDVIVTDSSFSYNLAVNGSAIYTTGKLNVYGSNFKDNCAKSYKLLSNNVKVTRGNIAKIKVYLEYGDNYPGIYSINTLKIDDKKISLNSGARDQIITLTISNKKYRSKTDSMGIAKFQIKTNIFNPNSYKFTLNHEKSTISTEINSEYTLKVVKKVPNGISKSLKKIKKKIKKTKKIKKYKKNTKNIIKKSNKNKKKIILFKNKQLIKKFKFKNKQSFLKWLKSSLGNSWNQVKKSTNSLWKFWNKCAFT